MSPAKQHKPFKYATIATVAFVSVLVGCKTVQPISDVRVTNGLNIGEDTYPAVVEITMGGSACTGTFVSDTTMITAAHCVLNGSQVVRPTVAGSGARSEKVIVHPNATGNVGGTDLAVAIFPAGTGKKFMPVAKRRPEAGDEITIVGYGRSDSTNAATAGRKRMGTNRLLDASGSELVFSGRIRNVGQAGDGQNVASASGDSGGPMFVKDELVGVTSGGYDDGAQKHSFYVNLLSNGNAAFLKSTLAQGAKIPSLSDDPLAAASRDLFVAIGEPNPATVDSYTLIAGVGANVDSVVFCTANAVSLCPESAPGFARTAKDRTLGDRTIFKAVVPTTLAAGKVLSFVALDGQGKIVAATAVRIKPAN